MTLLTAQGVEKAFGDRVVLRGCDLDVASGERVGLVGANGSGKSTLVRIVAGQMAADHGAVNIAGRMGFLDQEPVLRGETVRDCVDAAQAWHSALVASYHEALAAGDLKAAGLAQDRLDLEGWDLRHRAEAMLDRLGAPPEEARVSTLSGGERRRVALALALLSATDLLMLDEPTNHLDAEAVEWLQGFLEGYRGALVLVTHDRYLLEAVANRIVEVEDGVTISYPGSYADYLVARVERQVALQNAEDSRLELLAREAAWASRSPAARSTKQKARLQRLDALQAQRPLARERLFNLDLRTGQTYGKVLVELQGVRKGYGGRPLFNGLDLTVGPGDRVGIIGANGAGKSTLLKLIQGVFPPESGVVNRASRLKVGVLDQGRSGLNPDDTVFEAAGKGNDHVIVADRGVHVASFLDRFLFGRASLDQRVSTLSGGERARLLLARLLLEGAGLLLLDEPSNDLDLNTLRVLEEALLSYDGALVVVTHDRAFLDRVCNAVLAFEGEGRVTRYASRAQAHAAALKRQAAAAPPPAPAPAKKAAALASKRDKLSYKEKTELAGLPARIEELEQEQADLALLLGEPATWRDGAPETLRAWSARAEAIPAEIEACFARWSELEARDRG